MQGGGVGCLPGVEYCLRTISLLMVGLPEIPCEPFFGEVARPGKKPKAQDIDMQCHTKN